MFEREARVVEEREADRERQRDRDHHHQCGAQAERQQRQHHEADGDREVDAESRQPVRDVAALVEAALESHALRQVLLEGVEPRMDRIAYLEDVDAVLGGRRDEHRALALEPPDVGFLGRTPGDLGDVAHPDDASVATRHDGFRDLVERVVAAGGLEVVLAEPDVHSAAGHGGVLAAHRHLHQPERHAGTAHALEVDRDAHLRLGHGPVLAEANARDFLERVAQVLGEFLELAVAGRVAHQRKLHDVDEARPRLAHLERGEVCRQLRADAVHLADDLVVFLVRIGVPAEFGLDDADAVERAAVHLFQVVELADGVLDRVDDEALDVHRVCARVDGHDRRDRNVELRVLGPRDVEQRVDADGDQQPEQHQRELPAPDAEGPDAHDCGLSPAARRAARCGRR